MKGQLVKKNWYNNKQLREFHLFTSGEVQYFQTYGDKLTYKGSFWLGPTSKITKPDHMTLNIFCHEKQRTYILMQPDSKKVNFKKENEQGKNCFIIEWHKQMTKVLEDIKKYHEAQKSV